MTVKDDKKLDSVKVETIASTKRQEQKQEMEELLEHAKGKQKQRLDALKKAPASAPMVMEGSDRDELARYHVPDAFIHEKRENWRARGTKGEYNKGSTMVAAWTANDSISKSKQSDKGYLPVLDKGLQVSSGGGDILWEAPIVFAKHKLKRANQLNSDRINDEAKKYENETVAGGLGVGEDNSLTFEQQGD